MQQCSSRSFATGSGDCVCGVINHVVMSLKSTLCAELSSRFEANATICAGSGVSLERSVTVPGEPSLSPEFVLLAVCCNNLEVRTYIAAVIF